MGMFTTRQMDELVFPTYNPERAEEAGDAIFHIHLIRVEITF